MQRSQKRPPWKAEIAIVSRTTRVGLVFCYVERGPLCRVKPERERLQPAVDDGRGRHWASGLLGRFHFADQLREKHSELQSRQVCANAVVKTCSKRKMAIVRRGQIQLICSCEHSLVAVGRREPDHESVAGRDLCSSYGGVSLRRAHGMRPDRSPPEQSLDGKIDVGALT